jgi:hypothetical protein
MGTAAMVLGLLGLIGCVPLIGSILGIVFGTIGIRKADAGLADNRGMAQAGLIMGWIGLALLIVGGAIAFFVFVVAAANASVVVG